MRKLLLACIALLPALAMAQSAATDSAKVYKIEVPDGDNCQATIVMDGDGASSFTLKNADGETIYSRITEKPDSSLWDITLPFTPRKRPKFQAAFFSTLYIGWTHPFSAPSGIKNSVDFGVPSIVSLRWNATKSTSLSLGLGLGGNWYNADGHGQHLAKLGDKLIFLPNSTEWKSVKSKFTSTDLLIPLAFKQNIVGDFGFSLSAIASLSLTTDAYTSYMVDNVKYTDHFRNMQIRPFTADFVATLGWNSSFSVYFKYSPWSKFKDGFGPQFKSYSIGLQLNY